MTVKVECPACGHLIIDNAEEYLAEQDNYTCTNKDCRAEITVTLDYEEPEEEEDDDEDEDEEEEDEGATE